MNGHITNGQAEGNGSKFLQDVFELLVREGVEKGINPDTKVIEFRHPKELLAQLDLELRDDGEDDERLLEYCSQAIQYSCRTGHPRFFNQLFGGYDQYGLAGSWLSDTVNTSQYTFEVAPVFTLMEQVTLRNLWQKCGYTKGDGIFCPGGSISNMFALNVARYYRYPEVKTEGMHAVPKLCLFTSEQGHYSINKGAAFLGLGVNNVVFVKCDDAGHMIISELEKGIVQAKEEGRTPYLVNATAGTTVLGAYDPLEPIADLCEKYNLWMHVDCCWGGGALMSEKYKYLCKGIERSDSVAWNPHKMMGSPLQCCAFLTKHVGILQQAHSANAKYLFQQDKFYDVSYDTGDKSIQCGRKVDVFKLWLMWKAKGNSGFEKSVNNAFDNAKYLTKKIKAREGFKLVISEPECTNVCFWYIPPSMRGQEETEEWRQRLSQVAPVIKERMVKAGTMLIGYQPQGNKVNFFRMVISNLDCTSADMDFLINEIDNLGHDL